MKMLCFCLFNLAVAWIPLYALPVGTVLLGECAITRHTSLGFIVIHKYTGTIQSLVLQIEKGDLKVFSVVIKYQNGRRERISTAAMINQGNRSTTIPLMSIGQTIRSVWFRYRTLGVWSQERSKVILLGKT
jgi:hypothetical protein